MTTEKEERYMYAENLNNSAFTQKREKKEVRKYATESINIL